MKTKKLLATLLALVLLLSCMSITAFASLGDSIQVGETYTYPIEGKTLVSDETETGEAGNVKNITLSSAWSEYVELVSATQNGANIDVVVKAIKAISAEAASEISSGVIAYTRYDGDMTRWMNDSELYFYEITEPTKYAVTCAECTNGTVSVGDTTSYAEGETVTVIAAAAADYVLDKVTITKTEDSSDVTETVGYDTVAGTFAMPAYAVTVTATYSNGCYLDLDTTTTDILDSKDITQTYTFTESGDTQYTDASKVKVEWTVTNIGATYTGTKTWDPDEMKWVEAKAVTADDHTAEFKLTNYSSVKVNASVTFKAEDALAATLKSATFKNNDADVTGKTVTLDTPVTKDQETYKDSDFTAKAQTVTATLSFNKDEFAKLSEQKTEATYGTYTVKLGAVPATPLKLTQTTASITASGTYTVTENNLIFSGSTWEDVINANKGNTVTLQCTTDDNEEEQEETETITCHLGFFTLSADAFGEYAGVCVVLLGEHNIPQGVLTTIDSSYTDADYALTYDGIRSTSTPSASCYFVPVL